MVDENSNPWKTPDENETTAATGWPESTGQEETASPPPYQSLDARVVSLWRLTHLIGSGVLLLLAMVAGMILHLGIPNSGPWIVLIWLLMACVAVVVIAWHPPRAYRAWGYRIDAKVLETRFGIWFQIIQLLPLSRLQHVDLHRGPLERYYGLASVVLYTAGTHNASLVIPGLDNEEAVRLRDQLVAAGGEDDA